MSRYIDADKLISHIKDEIKGCEVPLNSRACGKTLAYGVARGLSMALSFAETLSIADVVEDKHGSWGFDGIGWTCSECGEYALSNKTKMQVHSMYCPHCGAKMDGERKEK